MIKKSPSILFLAVLLSISLTYCSNKNENSNQKNLEEMNSQDSQNEESKWTLVWSDEFNGDSLDMNNWNYQVEKAGRFNGEWQRYTDNPENGYVEDSCLVIKAIHKSKEHGMDQYTSARLNTANKQSWQYGKISARIKLPHGEGIWPAFWMLGANINENGGDTPWPHCGEIDILELYGSKDDGVIEANIHYANKLELHEQMGAVSYKLDEGRFADDFHIFELEWDENEFKWFVDGKKFASKSISAEEFSEFHQEFFILLNIAVGGSHAGRPDKTTNFPQYMYVDWIRVYQKA